MSRYGFAATVAAVVAGIAIVIGAFVAGSRGGGAGVVAQNLPERGISVSGHGEVLVTPDMAVLHVGVSVLADTVSAARDRAAESMKKVVDSVKANGVDEKDIQTTGFSIQPEYDYLTEKPELRGYRVYNTVSIKIRDIDRAAKVIDDAVAAGGDDITVSGIGFVVEDTAAALRSARELAMKDARDKAEQLAALGGVNLGDPLQISESGGMLPPPIPYDRAESAPAAGGPTVIQAGQLSVSVDLNVTYSIN